MATTPQHDPSTPDPRPRDGAHLLPRSIGQGEPLVCLPGGPLLDGDYLGDLGGLAARRRLVLVEPVRSGPDGVEAQPGAFRCDRLVDEVEAVRDGLGLARMDLIAHSAGANLALRYAEHHPERVGRLLLVTPSPFGLGVEVTTEARLAVAGQRSGEPWYPPARAAVDRILAGDGTEEDWVALTPFSYGRWDDGTRAYDAAMEAARPAEAFAAYGADGAFDPPATRAALARLETPVLVLAGGWDLGNPPEAMAAVAEAFADATFVVQPEAGHFPWWDDPDRFRRLVLPFLTS